MISGVYRFVTRPGDVEHRHPVLVFDREERLHLPLTAFAREAASRVASGTARTYLHAILPFFTYLEVDEWQVRACRRWDGPPAEVRQAVDDYLVQRLRCKVRPHRLGLQLVAITAGTRSSIRVFLSGLKLFYRVMQEQRRYPHGNPLVESVSATITEVEQALEREGEPPRMPDVSGVEEPRRKQRLSDSYFKLEGEEWVPHWSTTRPFRHGCWPAAAGAYTENTGWKCDFLPRMWRLPDRCCLEVRASDRGILPGLPQFRVEFLEATTS